MTQVQPTEYQSATVTPPVDNWVSLLLNDAVSSLPDDLKTLRATARQRLVKSAENFTSELDHIATDAGLSPQTNSRLSGNPDDLSVVMTGHQPVIFHSGLTFKYETTESFAAENSCIGIALVIDTDEGDGGLFSYPSKPMNNQGRHTHPTLTELLVCQLQHQSFSPASTLYSVSQLKPSQEIELIAEDVCFNLSEVCSPELQQSVRDHLNAFARLSSAGATTLQANLITRRLAGVGTRLLEIPLSSVASFPEMQALTSSILQTPGDFANAYNQSLETYRSTHKIRNPANPFPNLKTHGNYHELPFWVVNQNRCTRQLLSAQCVDGNTTLLAGDQVILDTDQELSPDTLDQLASDGLQIVPRGAIITAFLRLLFADIFVHGTGGGTYDQFTDQFARQWWGVSLPPFTVASASRYLFENERSQIAKLEELKESLRDLEHNPQRHFGTGAFSAELESDLQTLTSEKQSLVDQMKTARQAGLSAKNIGMQIQEVSNKIKSRVSSEFTERLRPLDALTQESREAIDCRTYPWFIFE